MSADRPIRPAGVIEISHAATPTSYSVAELIAIELGGETKMITLDETDGREHVAVKAIGKHPVSRTWATGALDDDRIAMCATQIVRALCMPDKLGELPTFKTMFEMNGLDGKHAFERAAWRTWRHRRSKGSGDAGTGGE